MATYLITGASGGIGLEFTKQLIADDRVGKVFAVSRSEAKEGLKELIDQNPERVIPVQASVDNTESVQKAAKDVEAKLNGKGLDVLINNAGTAIYSPDGIKTVKAEEMTQLFEVNVVGVHRMTAAFLPLLEKGTQKKVLNISTALASISWAPNFMFTPTHAYKASKAALNMLTVQYAQDHKDQGFTFFAVSPGWLKTNLGGGDEAHLTADVGVKEVKRILMESTPDSNGKFFNIKVDGYDIYGGGEIPW